MLTVSLVLSPQKEEAKSYQSINDLFEFPAFRSQKPYIPDIKCHLKADSCASYHFPWKQGGRQHSGGQGCNPAREMGKRELHGVPPEQMWSPTPSQFKGIVTNWRFSSRGTDTMIARVLGDTEWEKSRRKLVVLSLERKKDWVGTTLLLSPTCYGIIEKMET